jgi:hypothetical protein
MPAFFEEVIAAVGVDQDAKPRPGMIVPVGGSNVVRLSGGTGLQNYALPCEPAIWCSENSHRKIERRVGRSV